MTMTCLTDSPSSTWNSTIITIPDTLHFWPWPRQINPHYKECKAESEAWFKSLDAFSPEVQRAYLKSECSLLACMAYPLLNKEGCRIGCDVMALFFLIDEHTDLADNKTARAQADIIMDVIRHPQRPRPEDEWVGGKVARSFWLNVIKSATHNSQQRFISMFQLYVDAVVQQSIDRDNGHIRDIESYFKVRRNTVGCYPAFVIIEIHMNIPDEVQQHPVIMKLAELVTDMVVIDNDIISYKVEHERGDSNHNLVTIVMQQMNMDVQNAMNYVGALHNKIAMQFLAEWENIPVFGEPLDREVRAYCDGLGNWVRANNQWSFEGQRYLGKNGPEIQITRQIEVRI